MSHVSGCWRERERECFERRGGFLSLVALAERHAVIGPEQRTLRLQGQGGAKGGDGIGNLVRAQEFERPARQGADLGKAGAQHRGEAGLRGGPGRDGGGRVFGVRQGRGHGKA